MDFNDIRAGFGFTKQTNILLVEPLHSTQIACTVLYSVYTFNCKLPF